MSKSLNHNPSVNLTQEQFEELMGKYAQLKTAEADVNGNFTVGTNVSKTAELLASYGIQYGDGSDEPNAKYLEADVLREIESVTGYNTFPYCKQAYMVATDDAVAESVKSKSDVVETLKSKLRNLESDWHDSTNVKFDEIKGKNVHKDDEHLYGMKKNQSQKSAIDFLGEISKYSNNQYVKLLYDVAVQYNQQMYDKVQEKFASQCDYKKPVNFDEFLSKQQEKPYVTPTQGDAAFSRFDSKRTADIQMGDDIGVKVGPTGTMYGYDTSKGKSNTQSNTQRRSYGGEVDKYLNSAIENTPKQLQLGD